MACGLLIRSRLPHGDAVRPTLARAASSGCCSRRWPRCCSCSCGSRRSLITRAQAAAGHHRRPGGRLAQHDDRRERHRRARPRRSRRCRTACSPASQKKFQTRLYRLDSRLTRIADLKELQPARARHAHRRQPQAAGRGNVRPAARRHRAPQRRRGQRRRHRRSRRSPRFAAATFRFTRWASAGNTPAHDVEIDDAVIAPRALADSRLAAVVSFHQHGYAGKKAMLTRPRRRQRAGRARA